jgi:phage I-like protein
MSKYLVTDEDGNGHLPVRDWDNGPLNHHLMGAAWAELRGGYRGNKYQGPNKAEAIAKLKALYNSEGLPLPSESASDLRFANGELRLPTRFAFVLDGLGRSIANRQSPIGDLYEIPICVTGTWVKSSHKFSITPEDLSAMVRNFDKRKNSQVVVDYEHASEQPEVSKGGPIPAAGWIHALRVETRTSKLETGNSGDAPVSNFQFPVSLYASVEWTPEAVKLISGGQYRFFSPAIDWSFLDKETGHSQGATLTSGALTNHPFLEELPPISLTEAGVLLADVSTGYLDVPIKQVSVAYGAKGAKMAKKLSIKCAEDGAHQVFDGDDMLGEVPHEHLVKYCQTHLADDLGIPADGAPPAKGQAGIPGHQKMSELLKDSGFRIQDSGSADSASESAVLEQIKTGLKLAATHQLVEQREASRNLLLTECLQPCHPERSEGSAFAFNTEKAKQLLRDNKISAADLLDAIEAKSLLDDAVAKGKVLPKDRAFFFEIAFNNPKKFTDYIAGAVPVVTFGSAGIGSTENVPVDQEIDIETRKLMSDRKLSYGKAMKEVLKSNPQLEERYREAHRAQPKDNTDLPDRSAGITQ